MATVTINATTGSGQTLRQLSDILQQRMAYMRESARGSVAACMLDVLRSLRTITLVAKPSRAKVALARDTSLQLSYRTNGKRRIPCLRVVGSHVRYQLQADERFALAADPAPNADRSWQVYRFEDPYSRAKRRKVVIAAPNQASARKYAQGLARKRIAAYAGLAKKAIGTLMQKTFNKAPADTVAPRISRKAGEVTSKSEAVHESAQTGDGTYTLTLRDELRYATLAFRGGDQAVDVAMKKAMNKIVATINRKIPDGETFFGSQKLPTPFPEVRSRRK